jgi:hypothetical protein
MNPAILFWIAIFAWRAMSGRKEPAGQTTPSPQDVDGRSIGVVVLQLVMVGGLLGFLSAGWVQLVLYTWFVFAFPSWAAWQVCRPLGLRRTGLAMLLLVHGRAQTRSGRRRLFDSSLGVEAEPESPDVELPVTMRHRRSPRESPLLPADGWTTCAAVLRAENTGSLEEAERLVGGLLELPAQPRLPRAVTRIGFALLAEASLRRDDMAAVLRRASLGSGRGCRFYRLLARAHLTHDTPTRLLWLAWALAPRRTRNLRYVIAAQTPPGTGVDHVTAPPRSPWAAHLRLLERASKGESYDRRLVVRLAGVWGGRLDAAAQAHLRARALELGVIDTDAACRAVEEQVFADLEALSGPADGPWPSAADAGTLGGRLRSNAEDRLYAELEPWVEQYREDRKAEIAYPLVEWDRWVSFQAALRRLEEAFGEDAVATAWHGGLRLAAWNWPCRLLALHQDRAAWACYTMFEWTAAMAERFGDEEAARVNRENAAVAARQIRA